MRNRALIYFYLIIILIINIYSCSKEQPTVKIGFVANLTKDKTSTLAIATRNGALLAVDDINARGGIHGRKIKLIVKDDQLDPETAVKVDQELIRENVAAIVGHFHSAMSLAALPTVNKAKKVMISPISASSKLTGIDDYFFKINPPTMQTSVATAAYAHKNGLKQITVVYDLANRSYTETKFKEFRDVFKTMGGQITESSFSSGTEVSFPDLAANLLKLSAEGYFVIAGPYDTAMLCQHLRRIDAGKPIFISPFAYHPEIIRNGGRAVEGVILAHSFQRDNRNPKFLEFKNQYFSRYKAIPEMWETFGYEAVYALFQAFSKNPDPQQLKATLLKIGRFKGLQGDILFDRFGDNRRKPLLLTIKNGAFVEIRQTKNDL